MKGIKKRGMVDNARHLALDSSLPLASRSRVRIIVLYDEDDLSEETWLKAASSNPAFEDLHHAEEDIYGVEDGKLFND